MESLIPPTFPHLDTRDLLTMPLAQRRRLVRRWLTEQNIPEVGFAEIERVLSLLNDGTGPAKINLPGGNHARRRTGEIFLEKERFPSVPNRRS